MKWIQVFARGLWVIFGMALILPVADACTRVVYHGEDGLVVTGRTMDWREDIPASLWIMPREMTHDGGAGTNSVHWTSKYGSIAVSSFGFSTPMA